MGANEGVSKMKVSKALTSIVAASAVAGAISLAYAQTTTPEPPPAAPAAPATQAAPASPADQTMQNQSATPPAAASDTTAAQPPEMPAQADRN
jgi:hypothetical protein